IEIARQMPASTAALAKLRGVPRSLPERSGQDVLDALDRARALPEAELPVRPRGPRRLPPDPEFDALVERLRAARDRAAVALHLDRGFLMPRSQFEELARRKPRTEQELLEVPGVRRWQAEAAGKALLEAFGS